jgi:hypothetical protein
MGSPAGHWRIVANGYQGDLDINCGPDGTITGTVRIDSPNVDPINGTWDEAGQRLTFRREVTAADGSPQTHTGFLFLADAPLFRDDAYGPAQRPTLRVLTGSFDAYGTGGTAARPFYGWVAVQEA